MWKGEIMENIKTNKTANQKIFEKMPHSLEAEQALLGCLLLDTTIQVEVAAFLKEDDFFAESHKIIFRVMSDIINANLPVDLVTLTDALEKQGLLAQTGGIEYITTLADIMPSPANYKRYLDIVQRDSLLRQLMKGAASIIDKCSSTPDKNEALAFAEKTVYDIANSTDTSEITKISSVIPTVMNRFDAISKDPLAHNGIRTKFHKLDNLINGLQKSKLIVIAARPGAGKTSFAMNIVENVALQGYSCAVFSLEMDKEELTERILCSVGNVSMEKAKKGKMDQTDWTKIARSREKLSTPKIFIDDNAVSQCQEILSKCRRIKRKYGLDLVMIDYMQLMRAATNYDKPNRTQEISDISRNLKILAKELKVPVLALSQLNREVESRKGGMPQLSDLRESGSIEQDADIVLFIHHPYKYAEAKEIAEGKVRQNVAEIKVAKNRSGPMGVVQLYFKGESTKFINLKEDGEPDDDSITTNAKVKGYEELPSAVNVNSDKEVNPDSEIF